MTAPDLILKGLSGVYKTAEAEEIAARGRKLDAHRSIEAHLLKASGLEGKVVFDAGFSNPYGVLVDAVYVWQGDPKIAGFQGFALKKDGGISKNRRLIYASRVTRTEDYAPDQKGDK